MSIPYNDNLKWDSYRSDPHRNDWNNNVSNQEPTEPKNRAIQFGQDLARLVLKVPLRAVFVTPVFLPKNWGERERCTINAKLAGYSFVQMLLVPVKFMVAIAAILTSAVSCKNASQWLNNYSAYLDGRASQLEALKEEGVKKATTRKEFDQYKEWLYEIDPGQARK